MTDAAADDALRALLQRRADMPVLGWKIAVNFPTFQARLGISSALVAPLFELRSFASEVALAATPEAQLHVEAEVCLTLGTDVHEAVSSDALRAAIASARPCLELVDYARPRDGIASLFEHAFFHAGIVLGDPVDVAQVASLPDELPRLTSASGATHARLPFTVPRDLTEVIALAARRAERAGGMLRRGQLLLCGSYVEPLALAPGTRVQADYGFAQLAVGRAC